MTIGRLAATGLLIVSAACSSGGESVGARSDTRSDGARLFAENCSTCHAADGSGAVGPAIADGAANDDYTFDEMALVVSDGNSQMSGFGDELSAEAIDAIVTFVRSDLHSTAPADPGGQPTADQRTTHGAPPEIIDHAADWPLPNRDHANSRSTFDTAIDSSTVADLEEAWRYELPNSGTFGAASTTPLILGDDIFLEDNSGVVHAVDRDTGSGLWTAGPTGSLFGPTGVAVGWGKVFGTKTGESGPGQYIAAYDVESGEEIWATDITANGGQVNIQTSVHDGLVLGATSGFPAGVRGTITALDEATGAVVWEFDTIESPDLWGHPDVNSGGGAWYPPAVDPDTNTIYFGVGNPYPFPGAEGFPNATSRPGDNRWTSSTVALDGETGELAWGHQPFPHDLFDRDHVHAALGRVGTGDDARPMLVTAGKGGIVFGLDPTSGEELWSRSVGSHENDGVVELDEAMSVLPGGLGGVATPIAFAEGVAYVAMINAPITYAPDESSTGFGTDVGVMPSNVVAVDAGDGTVLWDRRIDGDVVGAMTVVNDLVLTSTLNGLILALDRETGYEVWSMQADGGINGWPAIAGDLIVIPVGFGAPAHLLALHLP